MWPQGRGGSNPLSPTAGIFSRWMRGRIAQLVRALRLHRRGPGFESLCAHIKKKTGRWPVFFFNAGTAWYSNWLDARRELRRKPKRANERRTNIRGIFGRQPRTRERGALLAPSEHGNPCAPTETLDILRPVFYYLVAKIINAIPQFYWGL